jgi:hypothetical protein
VSTDADIDTAAEDGAPERPEMLAEALSLARLGFFVYPIYEPAAPGACSCGCADPGCWERAKHPRIPDRDTAATTDAATIEAWWRRWPGANIGVACRPSGFVVVDVDVTPSGEDRLPRLVRRFGPETLETLVSRTGSGGWHLYYRAPAGFPFRNRSNWLAMGIDLRMYATLPPSLHSNWRRFAWRDGQGPASRPPAPLPAALHRALVARPGPRYAARMAPFWLADRLHLSYRSRRRVRVLQSNLHRWLGRPRRTAGARPE